MRSTFDFLTITTQYRKVDFWHFWSNGNKFKLSSRQKIFQNTRFRHETQCVL